jgi:hypothetical protein
MTKYYCNPLNFSYKYQFNQDKDKCHLNREAADPSLILFKGKYYLFPSMTEGYLVSDDLVQWDQKALPKELPLYDYAPDVRAVGDWMYFCASHHDSPCDFYRTKDPESAIFEKIDGTFDFWDPDLFIDDDGRMYFYWGCSNATPIYGVELNPQTMHQMGKPTVVISNNHTRMGYERLGENHYYKPEDNRFVKMLKENAAKQMGCRAEDIKDLGPIIAAMPQQYQMQIKNMLSDNPYIEGAWMTKHAGIYYLQYACPGAQYNTYADGVYVSKNPLGPFIPAKNNPYSYSPGGFLPGAGHGSTMEDRNGNLWHTSTMRISVNDTFERRIGLWPAGFDSDGELFCNQRYGDWPTKADRTDPWEEPEWMLLSYGKKMTASSEALPASNAVNENVQNWWKAEAEDTNAWLELDLGEVSNVHAVQINFADDLGIVDLPAGAQFIGDQGRGRYIEERKFHTRWLLEYSEDGIAWKVLADKRKVNTDLSHDLIVSEEGIQLRYLRLSSIELPYDQAPCISGLRVFGRGSGTAPKKADHVQADRYEPMSMKVSWQSDGTGYEVLWGHAADKLYHSCTVFGRSEVDIRALDAQSEYYIRVDAFNENGISHGTVEKVK